MLQQRHIQEEFLIRFTREIISAKKNELAKKHSEESEIARAKRQVEIEKLKQKFSKYGYVEEKPKQISLPKFQPHNIEPHKIIEKKENFNPIQSVQTIPQKPQIANPMQQKKEPLKIMDVPIPPQQPPLQPGEIDFGKIRFLVRDMLITYIECPGIDKNILIKRAGVITKIQITLTKEEILSIIKSFSEIARIPLIEGMLNARVSNLEMSAVVSESSDTSFILKKNPIPDMNRIPTNLQKPMMQIPAMPQKPFPAMPPINRPFTSQEPAMSNTKK